MVYAPCLKNRGPSDMWVRLPPRAQRPVEIYPISTFLPLNGSQTSAPRIVLLRLPLLNYALHQGCAAHRPDSRWKGSTPTPGTEADRSAAGSTKYLASERRV